MSRVWQSGRLKAVFSQVGTDSNGVERFVRNRFDVLRWVAPGRTLIEDWVVAPTADAVPPGIADSISAVQEEARSQDFGFYDLEPFIVEQHRSLGGDDGIFAVHFFGPV